jgi:hypothetical protein
MGAALRNEWKGADIAEVTARPTNRCGRLRCSLPTSGNATIFVKLWLFASGLFTAELEQPPRHGFDAGRDVVRVFSKCHQKQECWERRSQLVCFGVLNSESPSRPREGRISMQNAAREANGSVDSLPEHPALETAHISLESEKRSEMGATVAIVGAVGLAASAFEAALPPGTVLRATAICAPGDVSRKRAAQIRFSGTQFEAPSSNSRDERPALWRRALRPRRGPAANWSADLER